MCVCGAPAAEGALGSEGPRSRQAISRAQGPPLTIDRIAAVKLSDFSHVALSSSEAELKETSQACSFTAISK